MKLLCFQRRQASTAPCIKFTGPELLRRPRIQANAQSVSPKLGSKCELAGSDGCRAHALVPSLFAVSCTYNPNNLFSFLPKTGTYDTQGVLSSLVAFVVVPGHTIGASNFEVGRKTSLMVQLVFFYKEAYRPEQVHKMVCTQNMTRAEHLQVGPISQLSDP